ncbi:MAG: IS110 family transposase [Bacteroidia bacterium]|nr:IS110 family transposase [Bacteroidia bacterium]
MYNFFIGCDMSKHSFDIAYFDGTFPVYFGQFENNVKGFSDAVELLKNKTDVPYGSWFICFENTGVYSKPFLEWLLSQDIPCKEENALKISRSLGLRRGKSDKLDAEDICMYAFEKRDTIKPTSLANPLIVKLKKLLSQRELLLKQKLALEMSLKEQHLALEEFFYNQLNLMNQKILFEYKTQITNLEIMIEELIDQDYQTMNNHQLAQSVIGIGPVSSAYILAYTDNYTKFNQARKFACYSGIAPFPNQSGLRKGKSRVSHLANKKLKSLLSQAVLAAIQYDPQIKTYFHKKKKQGKAYGVIANAIKNKLIQRVFCVVNRQSPYVKLNAYT